MSYVCGPAGLTPPESRLYTLQDDAGPTNNHRKQQHQQQYQQLRVTPLGHHLAALPCPVRLGKMLVYGAVLGVLGPTLRCVSTMCIYRHVLMCWIV